MPLNATLQTVTERIRERSRQTRAAYVQRCQQTPTLYPPRQSLSCGNLAHAFAAAPASDKLALKVEKQPNLGIVTAYNDMLSAHQPFEHYPTVIRDAARQAGATAQVAGGVPAMCDGVTQGQPGMELSLFSRDVIAMSTAVSLSHNMYDAAICLGVCDKIVPGLLMGALSFGHLPVIFIPAGPMTTGISNSEKAQVRQLYAQGKIDRAALLESESKSYHSAGTCTFYGTANSNQMLMEFMGIHLPGTSFINPGTELRTELTRAATLQAVKLARTDSSPLYEVVDVESLVNGIVGLLATGGSTNLVLHIVAIARCAGVIITPEDFAELSTMTPLLARVYPNGQADVNHFHAAGGLGFVLRELLDAGLLHDDVTTNMGHGLAQYAQEPHFDGGLHWQSVTQHSLDEDVLRPADQPFADEGGMRQLAGNLGHGIMKVSAVKPVHWEVEAPAVVVDDQNQVQQLFEAGQLDRDCIVVVRFQGPAAIGMPELHKLTPFLSILQDRGFKVALVTDGRMSGASGKVPAAIHVVPEALHGGPLAQIQNGDRVRINANTGELSVQLSADELVKRPKVQFRDLAVANRHAQGIGRELFAHMRHGVGAADEGGSVFFAQPAFDIAPAEATHTDAL